MDHANIMDSNKERTPRNNVQGNAYVYHSYYHYYCYDVQSAISLNGWFRTAVLECVYIDYKKIRLRDVDGTTSTREHLRENMN